MDLRAKIRLVHVVVIVLSSAQICFVSVCLSDGQSVVTLKDDKDLPATVALPAFSLARRMYHTTGGRPSSTPVPLVGLTLRQLIYHPHSAGNFAPYGIGLGHDMFGRTWTTHGGERNLKQTVVAMSRGGAEPLPGVLAALETRAQFHIAPFLGCSGLVTAGRVARAFCYAAIAAAAVQVLLSGAQLVREGWRLPALATPLLQASLAFGFMMCSALIRTIYRTGWDCDNPLIPILQVDEHFDMSYAMGLVIAGMVVSVVLIFLGACVVKVMLFSGLNVPRQLPAAVDIDKHTYGECEAAAATAEGMIQKAKDQELEVQVVIEMIGIEIDKEPEKIKCTKEKQRAQGIARAMQEACLCWTGMF